MLWTFVHLRRVNLAGQTEALQTRSHLQQHLWACSAFWGLFVGIFFLRCFLARSPPSCSPRNRALTYLPFKVTCMGPPDGVCLCVCARATVCLYLFPLGALGEGALQPDLQVRQRVAPHDAACSGNLLEGTDWKEGRGVVVVTAANFIAP